MLKKLFLPVGIILAVMVAWVIPWPGRQLQQLGIGSILVAGIFAINGWSVRWQSGAFDRRFPPVFLWSAVLTLAAGPLLGRLVGGMLFDAPLLILGITLMAASPTMIASAIVTTEVAGGNTLWALFFTLGINLTSIFTMPVMLKLCVNGLGQVTIDSGTLLFKLIVLMLVPFLAGAGLRRGFRKKIMPWWFGYLPSLAVITIVYATMASAREQLAGYSVDVLAKVAVAALLIHLILMGGLAASGRRFFGLRPPENRALFFTGAQKSMVVGVSVLAALGGQYGAAAVVILASYFVQLLFDASLAAWLSGRKKN